MSTTEATTALVEMTPDELDAAMLQAIEAVDEPLGKVDPLPAPIEEEKPKKLTKAEKEKAAKEEARLALQARVPFELVPERDYGTAHEQKRKIDQWADDWGAFPRRYRSYSRDEWKQAIDLLASVVAQLGSTEPEYQRQTGLYVEEHSEDLLLIRSKEWQLVIQVPAKSSTKGKTFKLEAAPGKDAWGGQDKRADAFAELLSSHVPAEVDDAVLLDICCQYLRDVRIRVNRAVWGQANPDLAYLLDLGK